MRLMVLLLALLLVLVGGLLVSALVVKRAQVKARKQSIICITDVHQLLALVQKHRGMNASFLQGNQAAKSTLLSLREQISSKVAKLGQLNLVSNMERWLGFIDHWRRLQANSMSMPLQASFTQHTAVIENLLYMLEDVADQANLAKAPNWQDAHLALLWRELPLVVEYIGQARAVGMAVSTKGESSQIDKVKLGYLHDKIASFSSFVFIELARSSLVSATTSAGLVSAKSACIKLTNVIKSEFMQGSRVAISSEVYFELASNTMDAMNRLLEAEIQALTRKH